MFRLAYMLVFVLIYFIISIPVLLFSELLGLFSKKARAVICRGYVIFGFRAVAILIGVRTTYIGLENIPEDEAVLFVGNHVGTFDIILTYPVLKNQCGFISKKEFKKIPLFSWLMRNIYCLFLDRSDIKQGLGIILKAIEQVKSGTSMFIFPEGTRSRDGKVHDFKEGSLKIATKSPCRIIPVAIQNTDAIFEKQAPRLKKADVTIIFGEPIDPSAMQRDEQKFLGRQVHDNIQQLIEAHPMGSLE